MRKNSDFQASYNPIYFALQNRKGNNPPRVMGKLDNILIENVNCIKSVSQPVILTGNVMGSTK